MYLLKDIKQWIFFPHILHYILANFIDYIVKRQNILRETFDMLAAYIGPPLPFANAAFGNKSYGCPWAA